MTVEAPGFKTTVRDGIVLSVNDNLRLDLQLPLGQAAETVQVTGEVTAVQAESSSLGSVVSQKIVDTHAVEGAQQLFLYMNAPGVVGNRYCGGHPAQRHRHQRALHGQRCRLRRPVKLLSTAFRTPSTWAEACTSRRGCPRPKRSPKSRSSGHPARRVRRAGRRVHQYRHQVGNQ